jgi:hypothetical protein
VRRAFVRANGLRPGARRAAGPPENHQAYAPTARQRQQAISGSVDGKPFFYLGDTAWELFHRLSREEADKYLQDRAAKKFTVIQAVVLAEANGLGDPNPYGDTPLQDNDPTRPNPKYFEHVDWIVARAEQLGLTIGMLPTWGDKVTDKNKVFTPENARVYGEFLGRRYKDRPIIWVLGGDRVVENENIKAVWNAMAQGIAVGDGGRNLMTFHPRGGSGSSRDFHDAPWLDFNMWQTGHDTDNPAADRMREDWALTPTKPTMDGEPLYEDHPISFNAARNGYSQAADVRRKAYITLFGGGHGFTYGNHAVWQMWSAKRNPINGPLMPWDQAIDRPGARQMQHVRALMESRPILNRVPAPEMVLSTHNAGLKKQEATRDAAGAYAFVYTPTSRPITVDITKLAGQSIRAWWFDPRTGSATRIGEATRGAQDRMSWTPPNEGEAQDWVLVLDDAAANFPAPGSGAAR